MSFLVADLHFILEKVAYMFKLPLSSLKTNNLDVIGFFQGEVH